MWVVNYTGYFISTRRKTAARYRMINRFANNQRETGAQFIHNEVIDSCR